MAEKKEKETKQDIELTTVPTGAALAYKLPDGRTVNTDEYLVWLGNLVWQIKKSVA